MRWFMDYVIDMETLGDKPDAVIVDISIIPFNPDVEIVQSFDELVNQGKTFKLSIKSQRNRVIARHVLDWWKDQSIEAKQALKPSDDDLTIPEATHQILKFLEESGIKKKTSQGWCKGQSFDFPLFASMLVETFNTTDTHQYEPIRFWNQRDIRSAIESMSLIRGMTQVPLPKGTLTGFVAHNSLHDCAKEILMLKYAKRYALGIDEIPSEIDELSLQKPR